MNKKDVVKNFEENYRVLKETCNGHADKILEIGNVIIEAYMNGNKVLTAGNGGSAADAQHIATELVNKLYRHSKALSAVALTCDSAVVTAWSNDEGYDNVFERQVEAHGKEGDIFIGISTSGNSANVIKAINKANELGLITVGLLGKGGGKAKGLCKYEIIVPSDDVARTQEAHLIIYHNICEIVEEAFLK